MEMISVTCNHCGAPLEVGANARFVTCKFCNSQLEVKRSDSAIFTEEISRIAQNTQQMAGSLEIIELQNEIERLDREWMAGNPVSFDQHGRPTTQTSPGGAVFGLMFTIFFAIVAFSMAGFAASSGAPGIFALVPVGMGIFALAAGIMGLGKASQYQSRKSDYEQQRAAMVARLEAMRRE